jgi:predicted dehydrogenase
MPRQPNQPNQSNQGNPHKSAAMHASPHAHANAHANAFHAQSPLKPLKIAVIGAGAMGRHHLRICHELKEVELIAVVDVDQNRAAEMAKRYNIMAFSNVEELIKNVKVDAAIVAVPSMLHLDIGRQCLSQNIHCLIEKPLAISEDECLELIKLAEKNQLMLLVGHVERFNSAVQQLFKELLNKRSIQAIHVQRLNYNQQRLIDVDVILDLMTHDLDIVLSLLNKSVVDCSINTLCLANEGEADYASALLTFENGSIANVTASRITHKKVRKMEITTDAGFYTLDFIKQEIWVYRGENQQAQGNPGIHGSHGTQGSHGTGTHGMGSQGTHGTHGAQGSHGTHAEQIPVHKQDALSAEILNFVHSVHSGIAMGVTGYEALKTLKLIWQLQEKGRSTAKLEKSVVV